MIRFYGTMETIYVFGLHKKKGRMIMKTLPVGLQLYTVRTEMDKSVEDTLKKVKEAESRIFRQF